MSPSARRGVPSVRSKISSRIIRTKSGWLPTVSARNMLSPSSSQVCRASTSRSHRISTWSDRNPIGTMTMSRAGDGNLPQRVVDVGLEPGLSGRPAAALIHDLILGRAHALRDQSAGFVKLCRVLRSIGHRQRNAMSRVEHVRRGPAGGRNRGQCGAHPVNHRADETRMVEARPQLFHARRTGTGRGAGLCDILQVLPTGRIRAVTAGDECQRPFHAIAGHLGHGVGQQRLPVAIAPIHRHPRTMSVQFRPQRGHESPILGVQRADTAEVPIMFRDREHALAGHAFACEHVLQKGHHVGRTLGSAKRDDQHSIERIGHQGTCCCAKAAVRLRASRPRPRQKMTPTGFEPVLSA